MNIPFKGLTAKETHRRNNIWRLISRHGETGIKLDDLHDSLAGYQYLPNSGLTKSLALQMVRNGHLRMQQPGNRLVLDETCKPLPGFEEDQKCA